LAVPRGTVKLPGGYEVVVPEKIVEHEIRLVKEDPHTGGLLLGNRKNKFGYQKGTLNFMLTTGRFPKPAEAVKIQKIAEFKNDELGER
jgi:hypothetical protein